MNDYFFFDGINYKSCDITEENGKFCLAVGENISKPECGFCVLPGLVDVHVHFREPGFAYKETIKTGSMAAAAGGYTEVCTMPNLIPAPDCAKNLFVQQDIINNTAVIGVHPYGTITKEQKGEELSLMDELAENVKGYTDDGRGIQSDDLMKQAMLTAKKHDKIIVAHCEVNALLNNGYIHLGEYAAKHNHRGICSESEYQQLKRDIDLVRQTGVKYHACHISTAESVQLVREAKAEGLDVTCETAPHYLTFSDNNLQEHGRFKMNPPIRSEKDKAALIEGIVDGTIDIIATDHAPHSDEEKSKGLEKSAMGIVGLETAFSVLYTNLVKTGIISFNRLIELMHFNPKNRFLIETTPEDGSFTVFDLNKKYVVDSSKFQSKGRATPYDGHELYAKCVMTFYKRKKVWEAK